MARAFDAAKFNREMRAVQRRAEGQLKREIGRVNRNNQRRADAYNRKVDKNNKKVVADYNRRVNNVNAHNRSVIAELNRQLRAASSGPRYTADEQALADRVQGAVAQHDDRKWDTFPQLCANRRCKDR